IPEAIRLPGGAHARSGPRRPHRPLRCTALTPRSLLRELDRGLDRRSVVRVLVAPRVVAVVPEVVIARLVRRRARVVLRWRARVVLVRLARVVRRLLGGVVGVIMLLRVWVIVCGCESGGG